MKELMSKTKINWALVIALISLPLSAFCDGIQLGNNTQYMAAYVIKKGDQVIARIPGIAPGQTMLIPTNSVYVVTASTVIDGNTYTSAPIEVSGAMGFLAQVRQIKPSGTYQFEVVATSVYQPNTLAFQKTNLNPVTFTISKDGHPLQSIVLNNSFEEKTLRIDDIYSVYGIINGITTEVYTFTNPNSTITAVMDESNLDYSYFFSLEIN